MQLDQHKILITGGSTGIGLALAKALIARGNQVAICGRRLDKLEAARASLPGLHIIQCDLTDPAAAEPLITRAAEALGGLSILINNAGMQNNFSFATTDADQAIARSATEIQVNLTSLLALTARALPHLRAVTTGAIINVSSALVFSPKADAAIYCATKAAVHSFTQALRYQMADDIPHIKVFEIMPPLTDTDMTEGHGTGKITPDQVAVQTLRGIASDVMEIRVGKAKLLGFIQRLSPALAAKIIRNS
jgi:short-subunit dehydrogenase involved in D-alanine esterification of teichoic acids